MILSDLYLRASLKFLLDLFLLGVVVYLLSRRRGWPGWLLLASACSRLAALVFRLLLGYITGLVVKQPDLDMQQLIFWQEMRSLADFLHLISVLLLIIGLLGLMRDYLRWSRTSPPG